MPFAALALVLLGALWGVGGPRRAGEALARAARGRAPGSWRPGMGALALGAAVAALFLAARGAWAEAAALACVAAVAAAAARRRGRVRPVASRPLAPSPNRREAAELLGVGADASAAEVRAAYARLIRRLHPDAGGTPGLAAQLNRARDVLLGAR